MNVDGDESVSCWLCLLSDPALVGLEVGWPDRALSLLEPGPERNFGFRVRFRFEIFVKSQVRV